MFLDGVASGLNDFKRLGESNFAATPNLHAYTSRLRAMGTI
jgi:hypothetical protein